MINGLLTKTEKIMLAKRLSIAFLLSKNYTYARICGMLKVCKSTVWQAKSWIDIKGERYKRILKELIDKVGDSGSDYGFFDFLDDLFPPTRGTDWKVVRKKQWQKRRARVKPF